MVSKSSIGNPQIKIDILNLITSGKERPILLYNRIMDIPHNKCVFIDNRSAKSLPGVAMVFSMTSNDEILVPGLLESFYFCDFFIAYYDDGTDFAYDESKRHKMLIDTAKANGAKWVYLTQPTVRLGSGWRDILAKCLSTDRPLILHSPVYYFWDYSLDTIRTDLTKFQPGCFFRIHPQNSFSDSKLHHMAVPVAGERVRVAPIRYNMNRLGREVCLAKANYYQAKDGTPHNTLRDFSHIVTKKIEPSTIRGLGSNELEYIKRISASFCDQKSKGQAF